MSRLFIELEKRQSSQQLCRERDLHTSGQRLANSMRSNNHPVFGDVRKVVTAVLTPYAQTNDLLQMKYAQSYTCRVVPTLDDALSTMRYHELDRSGGCGNAL